LFAIARHKIAERNRRHRVALNRLVDPDVLDTHPEYLHDEAADTELRIRKRELLPIVAVALRSLSPQLRTVLTEVICSPDIRGSELARRLGWEVRRADHELNRARTELLDAVGTVFVVRTGRQDCPRLDRLCRDKRIPAGRYASLTEEQRRSVQRHIRACLFLCRPRAAKGR